MGKIYKNPNPSSKSASPKPILSIPTPKISIKNPTPLKTNTQSTIFVLPDAVVVPLEQFDELLQQAVLLLEKNDYHTALPILLNLEITNFDDIKTHELLADLFLNINQLALAKEQLQICSRLIKVQTDSDIFTLKSFDQLLEEAGDFNQLEIEYKDVLNTPISEESFHIGTKTVLNLATHHMAANRYKEAEKILTEYRDRYLSIL